MCQYQLEDCGVRVPRKFRRRQDLPLNAQVRTNFQLHFAPDARCEIASYVRNGGIGHLTSASTYQLITKLSR